MRNSVELLTGDIIYVVRRGSQTEASIKELNMRIAELAAKLRSETKPVLILTDVKDELPISEAVERVAIEVGATLDFDKCAFFPVSGQAKSVRDIKVRINAFDAKVQNFASKEDALHWLESFERT